MQYNYSHSPPAISHIPQRVSQVTRKFKYGKNASATASAEHRYREGSPLIRFYVYVTEDIIYSCAIRTAIESLSILVSRGHYPERIAPKL